MSRTGRDPLALLATLALASLGGCGGGDSGGPGGSQTVTLIAPEEFDGYIGVHQGDPSNRLMAQGETQLAAGGTWNGSDEWAYRGFVGFDLAPLGQDVTVESAVLRVAQLGPLDGDPYVVYASRVVLDHILLAAPVGTDLFDSPALASGFTLFASSTAEALPAADVSVQLQADLDAGRAVSGYRLRLAPVESSSTETAVARFASAETGTPPELVVTYRTD